MPSHPQSARYQLLPHPRLDQPALPGLVRELSVALAHATEALTLRYRLSGELSGLRLPEFRGPERTDGLWKHSCFEAFLGRDGSREYWEYNFSPSGAWAAYHFSNYREHMAPFTRGAPPRMLRDDGADWMELEAVIDLSFLPGIADVSRLRLGLAAVIEDEARVLSYWALRHPAEKPDFHHAAGFAVELDRT